MQRSDASGANLAPTHRGKNAVVLTSVNLHITRPKSRLSV